MIGVAVVGVPDARQGEVPVAFVVAPGAGAALEQAVLERELRPWVEGYLQADS